MNNYCGCVARHQGAGGTIEALESRVMLAAVSFAAPVTANLNFAQYNISSTTTVDFNGDGIPDLLIGHQNGSAQLFLGTATGVFQPGLVVGPGAQILTSADFNGDGQIDVATALGVLPGNGNGTFGATPPSSTYALPPNTVSLYAADVNGDGHADIIAATFPPATSATSPRALGLSVMLGNGDGSFKSAVSTPVGSAVGIGGSFANLEFDDFNNDGKIDVLSAFGVMLGNGDGTFKSPLPLALTTPAASGGATPAPALPSAGVFATGDFNGDGTLDVAILPPSTAPAGEVEILIGKGDGTFADRGPITVASGSTLTALDTQDLNADGQIDLVSGATIGANASSLAVLLGNGDGTFAMPQNFTVPGPPLSIRAQDFNADGNPDLLSLNAAAGSALDGSTALFPATASVLLNSKTAPVTPVVAIGASANRVVAGTQVKLSASVSAPPPAIAQPGTVPTPVTTRRPTGTVTFSQGSTVLGVVPLKNGSATFLSTATGVGVQQITAAYSGDANYAAAVSAPITRIVLLSSAAAPLLNPSLTAATLPPLFIPRDPGTVALTITNGGGAPAVASIAINLYLSTTGAIDSSSIPISAPSLQNRALILASGRSTTWTAHFLAGSYPPGSYKIIAQVVPISGFTSDQLTQDTFVSPASFVAAGMVFGTVGTHHGLTRTVTDASGNRARFSLAGLGMGTVTDSSGLLSVALAGTTAASQLSIVPIGSVSFSVNELTVNGSIGGISAPKVTLTNSLSATGSVGRLVLASAGGAGAGVLISFGVGAAATVSIGSLQNVTLDSASTLRSLTASAWNAGAIIAPSIGTLSVRGDFSADVQVHKGGSLRSATLGSVSGGLWSVSGGIGTLRVAGDLANASLYAGADAGPDNVLGTQDDRYTVAPINTIFIGGSVLASLLASSAAPLPGGTIFQGFSLLPGGAIRSVVVRGAISADSRFAAASLPRGISGA